MNHVSLALNHASNNFLDLLTDVNPNPFKPKEVQNRLVWL